MGFGPISFGEVRVVSFGMAQTAGYPLMIIANHSPQIVLHERQLLPPARRDEPPATRGSASSVIVCEARLVDQRSRIGKISSVFCTADTRRSDN